MASRHKQIISLLADGAFHSGTELATALGISRSAVCKHLHTLVERGIELYRVPGRGYRLARPIELLDPEAILNAMHPGARRVLSGLEIHAEIDSTNQYLLRKLPSGLASGYACLAECQNAGRGRCGRHWVSPFGCNLYLSLLWRFEAGFATLGKAGLVAGSRTVRALEAIGVNGVGLKWPNDLLWRGQKLAGILIDMVGELKGPCALVVGIGINVAMPREAALSIDRPWTDLATITGGVVDRNRLAGCVLDSLLEGLGEFERSGLGPSLQDWEALDETRGRWVALQVPGGEGVRGIALGITERGSLRLLVDGRLQEYEHGEVTLRETAYE